ncbi:uncharacterized protein [Macrobrachium rosenbergii]|uniref:uncharacterized protein n=1 Tax=Macrobrachium rosenbergii TaxID=79674 RepID=UPI0034D4C043
MRLARIEEMDCQQPAAGAQECPSGLPLRFKAQEGSGVGNRSFKGSSKICIFRKSSEWDAAATNFVQNVFEHKHSVNFVPVKYDSDGCLHGLLTVSMNLSEWASVLQSCTSLLPELLEITTKQSTSSKSEKFEKDLAQILVHLNFANYEREVLEDFARNKCGVQGLPSLQIGYRSDGRLKYQLSDSKTQDSNNEEKEQRAILKIFSI